MSDIPEDLFYGLKEDESLELDSYDVIDNLESYSEVEYPVDVFEYERAKIKLYPEEIVADILEKLEEEYGDPEGDNFMCTSAMIKACSELCETIKKDYLPSMCEPNGVIYRYHSADNCEVIRPSKAEK